MAQAQPTEPTPPRAQALLEASATLLIALAAILTAWCAFESAKWNGVQGDNSRLAAAAGTAAARETTIASAQQSVDVGSFLQWLQAVRADADAGRVDPNSSSYVADPATLSGFIAARFRSEFKPAFEGWISTRPLVNPSAPSTPFDLPAYSLAAEESAADYTSQAQENFSKAEVASSSAESYVLLTVLFAIALVLTNIGNKVGRPGQKTVVMGVALASFLTAVVLLATYPISL